MKILLQKASGSLSIVSSLGIHLSLYIFSSQFLCAFYCTLFTFFPSLSQYFTFYPSFPAHLSSLLSSFPPPFFLHLSFLHLSLISTFSPLSLSLWWWMMRPNHSTATQCLKQTLALASSFSRIVQSPLPTLWGIDWEKLLKEKEILVFP